ncbi:hypothetical protein [Kitasatospora phosalacinea]|uniref:hypothetical protein n=1 Tax=Kitasatospora phosalacinea TaxID=2065 RepID=UPI0005247AFF|nr:hypothetical protein [Kitasatospora phosalacinea]
MPLRLLADRARATRRLLPLCGPRPRALAGPALRALGIAVLITVHGSTLRRAAPPRRRARPAPAAGEFGGS